MSALEVPLDVHITVRILWGRLSVDVGEDTNSIQTDELAEVCIILCAR